MGKYQDENEFRRARFMRDAEKLSRKYKSTTHYMLAALMPYTEANLKFTFSPRNFFSDLAKLEYQDTKNENNKSKYRQAYYRAIKEGLITLENEIPRLTQKGERKLKKYRPKLLKGEVKIVAVFDIPESDRNLRTRFRTILREFQFEKIQRSVWESKYDCLEYLREAIKENRLEKFVKIYEANEIR